MDCKEIKEKLVNFPENGISDEEKESILGHLVVCPSCREEREACADTYLEFCRFLEDTAAEASPSPQAWASIKQRIAKKHRRWIPTFAFVRSRVASWARGCWHRPVWQRAVGVASVVALTAALLVTQLTVGLSPAGIIARAQEAAAEVDSYHVTQISFYNNKSWIMRNETDYMLPDRMRSVQYFDDVKNNETIFIGEDRYSWFRETGQWILGTQDWQPASVAQMSEALMIIGVITQVEVLPDELINGVNCLHYKASYNPKDPVFNLNLYREALKRETDPDNVEWVQQCIEELEQAIAEGKEVPDETAVMNYWISKDDYLIRQSHSVYSRQWQGELEVRTFTATYSQFNEPVEIEAPTL